MNQPGLSLFQGAGSLHLNNSAQRLEEEEELADQQRRRAEVQNRLDKEFGDISDDNDETNVSAASEYLPPRYPQAAAPATTPFSQNRHHNAENILPPPSLATHSANPPAYDERGELLAKFKDQQELEDLRRRLALCEAEKQRAFMARQQSHELLVEAKGKISDQEDGLLKLQAKLRSVEKTNTELATQLECKQTMLSDALLKHQMIERNLGNQADRNAELAIKQANDRCAAAAAMHQQQMDTVREQLATREQELHTLQARHTELQRSREALLLEKSETINQLSRTIEDAQRQNQQLIARGDGSFEENARLKCSVEQMCGQIAQLERSLHTANAELNSMTSLLHESQSSTAAKSPHPLQAAANGSSNSSSSPYSTPILHDTTSRLRSELARSLADQKERRAELVQLQQQHADRLAEVQKLREDENRLLVELETMRAEAKRSGVQVRHLCGDLQRLFRLHGRNDEVDSATSDKIIDAIELAHESALCAQEDVKNQMLKAQTDRHVLEQRLQAMTASPRQSGSIERTLSSSLRAAQTEVDALRSKCEELVTANEKLTSELDKFRAQAEELGGVEMELREAVSKCQRYEKEMVEMRESYEAKFADLNHRLHLEGDVASVMAEKNKTDTELKQLRDECTNYRQDIASLTAQLQHSADTIADLRHSVTLKQDHDKLLADLQTKAQRFDEYIQQQKLHDKSNQTPERCASAPNPPQSRSRQSPASSVLVSPSEAARRSADEVRMAAVLARKLKAIEDAAKHEEQQLRQALREYELQLNTVRDQLEIRNSEVQLLKQAICGERNKMKQLLQDRDAEVEELFEKQQCTMDKYRERLDMAQDEMRRLQERCVALQAERAALTEARDRLVVDRERLKADRDRHEGDREAWTEERAELGRRLQLVERDKKALAEEWAAKYKAAKKTAASYKKYAEEKDVHIARENERIQRALDKMQNTAESIVKQT